MPTLHELRSTRESDLELLERFYQDAFIPEFPDRNEREPLANIEEYLHRKETGWYGKNNYHVVVMCDGDKPIGGSISDYLVEPNAGFIEYIVMQPDCRGRGYGRRLLEHTERLLHEDAEKRGGRLDWIVIEVDDPYNTHGPANRFDPFTRVRVWDAWGYRLVDFPYVQPALSSDREPVDNLLLAAKTCSERFGESVPSNDVCRLVREYFRCSIEVADGNEELEKMCQFLRHQGSLRLVPFSEYLGREKRVH
ncbi:MAG: GNAT family N-acetyltransferase [Mycobacterium sp.]